jgi:membrane fusion protein (multidrug efflux system)
MSLKENTYGKAMTAGKNASSALIKSVKDSIDAAPPEIKKPAKKLLVGALVLFCLISGFKLVRLKIEESARAKEIAAGPMIRVAQVMNSLGEHETSLLGETRPYQSATLYAKVSGYLKSVKVDKGDVVKQGQILAVIESPETDQDYQAALADAHNKHDIAGRTQTLRAKGLVSQQEAEQAQSDADVAAARLHTQETLKGYETIRAPFPGVVTARYADPGALVQNATNSQSSALPVVTVSQIKQLRVDVFLDQRDAPFVVKDEPVHITIAERPGLVIEGRVDRISGELDSRTKMMLTEIDIPNEDGQLVAGSFVQVGLKIKSPPYVQAPVESLVLKDNKPFLTVVTPDNQLTYKPIDIASNDGKLISIISGVQGGDKVALNVGDAIPEGGKVRPIVEEKTAAAAPTAVAPSPAVSGSVPPKAEAKPADANGAKNL